VHIASTPLKTSFVVPALQHLPQHCFEIPEVSAPLPLAFVACIISVTQPCCVFVCVFVYWYCMYPYCLQHLLVALHGSPARPSCSVLLVHMLGHEDNIRSQHREEGIPCTVVVQHQRASVSEPCLHHTLNLYHSCCAFHCFTRLKLLPMLPSMFCASPRPSFRRQRRRPPKLRWTCPTRPSAMLCETLPTAVPR